MRPAAVRPAPPVIKFAKRKIVFWNSSPCPSKKNPMDKENPALLHDQSSGAVCNCSDAALGFKRNSLRRHLSVEIEVDNITSDNGKKLASVTKKWSDSIVTDGSLHANNAHETNTTPSNGDKFVEHIEALGEAYKDLNARCTDACGLHVHVNCSDLKFYDLRKVILLYARVERALFELCAPRRANSNYSKLCGENYSSMSPEPEAFKRQLLGKFYASGRPLSARPDKKTGSSLAHAKLQKYNGMRYRALNLHSYFLRKTIEFRHHEGSVDPYTITSWARICGHVIEAANTLSESQIRSLPKDGKKALLEILPDDLRAYAKEIWKNAEFDWRSIDQSGNVPDLPKIPESETRLDRKERRKLFKEERKARRRINEYRLAALRAIITGTRLDTTPLTTTNVSTVPRQPVTN